MVDRDQVYDWLHGEVKNCPMCRENNWIDVRGFDEFSVLGPAFMTQRQLEPDLPNIEVLRSYFMVCANCGFTALHNKNVVDSKALGKGIENG